MVLVCGGQSNVTGTAVLNTTEIYDPVTNAITAGPAMTAARTEATAVEYGTSGAMQVLVAGGSTGTTPLATAETYSETTNTFSSLGTTTMTFAHAGGNAALLDNGNIIIEGGESTSGAAGAELFNPTNNTFTNANINTSRSGDALASIGNEACVGGGTSANGVESSTETYDVTAGTFTVGPSLANARTNATATTVASDNVVFIGGHNGSTAVGAVEMLTGPTLATGTMSTIGTLVTARYGHTSTALSTGTIIVIGGFNAAGTALNSIEQVNTSSATSTASSSSSSSSSSSGLGGLLSGLLGGSSGSSSGLGSLLSGLLGGSSGSSSSSSGIGSLLSSLLGGSSSSSSTSGSSGLGSIFSSLLGALTGTGSSSSTSGSGSGGLGSIFSSLFGGLFGGSSSGTPASTGAGTAVGQVLSCSPSVGGLSAPLANGITIQINGFGAVGSAFPGSSVTVGNVNATVISDTGTTLVVTLPYPLPAGTSAGPADIVVTDSSGNTGTLPGGSGGFTFQ
jgi:hypothetical protein